MKHNKKLIVPPSKPRNPLVAVAKLRSNAGAHHASRKTERQQARRALHQVLKNPADSAGFFV